MTIFAWIGVVVCSVAALGLLLIGIVALVERATQRRLDEVREKLRRLELLIWLLGLEYHDTDTEALGKRRSDEKWFEMDFSRPFAIPDLKRKVGVWYQVGPNDERGIDKIAEISDEAAEELSTVPSI